MNSEKTLAYCLGQAGPRREPPEPWALVAKMEKSPRRLWRKEFADGTQERNSAQRGSCRTVMGAAGALD